jgi:4-aminobutyrate aminotransferase / (S)-3-amino-2-methylpropionate transaminase / 5-aminovalerate transaminase
VFVNEAEDDASTSSEDAGAQPPRIRVPAPGAASRAWLARHAAVSAPMGPKLAPSAALHGVVLTRGFGANLFDADDNRYVDLASGFGALLLGHSHPEVVAAVERQSARLLQALGDLYPSEEKVALLEALADLYPAPARALIAQSGSDAVSAALKTAVLYTNRPGVIAFTGAYHGLSYGPLAALGLRPSYREPFGEQLNPRVRFVEYPSTSAELDRALAATEAELSRGDVGAILVEPILGRGGVVVPPSDFVPRLAELARAYDALLIADEIWTGLGRSGAMLYSTESATPDLICLGKGLGGGVPVSAVLGRADVMQSWSRDPEVVHTSTFAGAPLACAAALATLGVLRREALANRARELGARFVTALERALAESPVLARVRGSGLMIGIELFDVSGEPAPGIGSALQRALLHAGYVTSTGGGQREVLVLTPPLTVAESRLSAFVPQLLECLREIAP